MGNILVTILAVLIVAALWVMIYDSSRFVTVRYEFCDRRLRKDCRAVVLADLHNKKYGRDNELLLEAIRAEKPDVILVAGDMLTSRPGRSFQTALRLLEELGKEYPVYYGNGNHEQRLKLYPEIYGDMAERYGKALEEIGISPLVNSCARLDEYGMTIYGAEIDRAFYKRFHTRQMPPEYLREVLGMPDEDTCNVLLAHNPDYFPQYAAWGADLVLSGHVHGGVVRVPFWGKGVASPSVRLFPRYDGGRFEEAGSVMFLSRGLGTHTIPFRLFNPAELLVVDFHPNKNLS